MITGVVWSAEYRQTDNESKYTEWYKTKAECIAKIKELQIMIGVKQVRMLKHTITYYDWKINDR